jgi:hypothetical protein
MRQGVHREELASEVALAGLQEAGAAEPAAPEVPAPGSPEEHPIVAAVRKELEAAGKAETVDGQAALLLASQAGKCRRDERGDADPADARGPRRGPRPEARRG